MQIQGFDLNDNQSEPTDEQLQSLKDDVADEARRKRDEAAIRQMEVLRRKIDEAQRTWFPQ